MTLNWVSQVILCTGMTEIDMEEGMLFIFLTILSIKYEIIYQWKYRESVVEISKGINIEPLLICNMYRPPSASQKYFDNIVENIELASSTNMQIIILGDLNFNYQIDESLSSNAIHLIANLFQMTQIIKELTRKTPTTSTLLDVILTPVPDRHTMTKVIKTAFSDHYSLYHYDDVIMGTIASQITSLAIVYSTVYLGADQRKHQSSASLAFVRGFHRGPVNSPHKWPVTRIIFPFDDVIMTTIYTGQRRQRNELHNLVKFCDYKYFNEEAFLLDLRHNDWFHHDENDVEKSWKLWKQQFTEICHKHAPFVEKRLNERKYHWITPDIVNLGNTGL